MDHLSQPIIAPRLHPRPDERSSISVDPIHQNSRKRRTRTPESRQRTRSACRGRQVQVSKQKTRLERHAYRRCPRSHLRESAPRSTNCTESRTTTVPKDRIHPNEQKHPPPPRRKQQRRTNHCDQSKPSTKVTPKKEPPRDQISRSRKTEARHRTLAERDKAATKTRVGPDIPSSGARSQNA